MKPISVYIAVDTIALCADWIKQVQSEPGLSVTQGPIRALFAGPTGRQVFPQLVIAGYNKIGKVALPAPGASRQQAPDYFILGVGNTTHTVRIQEFLHAGGTGYILQNAPGVEWLQAIYATLQGKRWISNEVRKHFLSSLKPGTSSHDWPRMITQGHNVAAF